MTTVTVHHAKTHLSKLLADVEAGGEVVIARGSRPIAKLVALEAQRPQHPTGRRQPGRLKGLISMDDRFFEPLSDEEIGLGHDPNL